MARATSRTSARVQIANWISVSKNDPTISRPQPTAVPPARPQTEWRSSGKSRLARMKSPI